MVKPTSLLSILAFFDSLLSLAAASSQEACTAIIAIALTSSSPLQEQVHPAEEFICVRPTGEHLPVVGTDDQLSALREALHDGRFVSAESTVAGLTEEHVNVVAKNNNSALFYHESETTSEVVVTLPPFLKFQPASEPDGSTRRRRGLASYTGEKKVLLVKVTDKDGRAHPDSPTTMSNKVFGTNGDTTNMKDQFAACSFGDFTITNEYDYLGDNQVAKGVIAVNIGISLTSSTRSEVQQASKKAAEDQLYLSLPGPFDHVMFSIENCYGSDCSWAAYGGINSWFTVYKQDNYKYPAVAMHEIGHNLNLAHSGGSDGKTYTDHSCLMGNPWFRDDISAMCFNPAKSFQLSQQNSWYSNHIRVWNSGNTQPKANTYNIIGIADYGNNPNNYPVVIKLETLTASDIFVGFNRVRGINANAKDAKDRVSIIEQGGDGKKYATSIMLGDLGESESYTFNNWQNSGKAMVITVQSIERGSNPWYATVEFNFDNAGSETPAPTPKPTPMPTPIPTPKPNTLSPTKRCGDYICQSDEDHITCPADCINAEFSTYDDNIGAKGSNGTMFTLQAVRDVEINSFYTFVRSTSSDLVQVYTRQGEYGGYETSSAGWELVFDKIIFLNGPNQVTELPFSRKVVMAAGQLQSFYVYSPSNLAYRSENLAEGDLVKGDTSFKFFAGIAIAFGTFGEGQLYSPRVFSGILSYDTITLENPPTTRPTITPTTALTALPTPSPSFSPTQMCGNGVCDMSEYSNICSTDCKNIGYKGAAGTILGANGFMFYIKAVRDIIVTSFDVYVTATSQVPVPFQVYTRVDSYKGHIDSESGWNMFYDNPALQGNGRDVLTSLGDFSSGVLVPAGATMSFYLYTNNTLIYIDGSGASPYSYNNALELYEGVGIDGLFADGNASSVKTYAPRVFAGNIRYDVIEPMPTTSSPTSKPSIFSYPTQQPVRTCGNSMCEISEYASTCPEDCSEIKFVANEVGAKGAQGIMFSVLARDRNISTHSFDFFTNEVTTGIVQVYTRAGPFRGHEESVDGWELIFDDSINLLGRDDPTSIAGFDRNVEIRANTLQSFLIYTPNFIMYRAGTNETSEGSLYSTDRIVELYEGIGLYGSFFSSWTVYSPRVFRGSVVYDVISDLSDETDHPTSYPTTRPSKAPSPDPTSSSPTAKPTRYPTTSPSRAPSQGPTANPISSSPTAKPSTLAPSRSPTQQPITHVPSNNPTRQPVTSAPSEKPTASPSLSPSASPTTEAPSPNPSISPRRSSSISPSSIPSIDPSKLSTASPSKSTMTTTTTTTTTTTATASITPSIANSPSMTPSMWSSENPSANQCSTKKVKIQSTQEQALHMFEVKLFSDGIEVASQGVATQSSTFRNDARFSAANANDGIDSSFSHTESTADSWWQLEFQTPLDLEQILILNRYCRNEMDSAGCLCRMSFARIELYDELDSVIKTITLGDTCNQLSISASFSQCISMPSPSASPLVALPTQSPVGSSEHIAKKLKIQSANERALHMLEVMVMSRGINVALDGTSSQSSTFKNAEKFASPNAHDADNSTFSHTNAEVDSWWQVELKESVPISDVVIMNRYCQNEMDPSGCLCRLSDSTLTLIDEDDSDVDMRFIGDTCNELVIEETFLPAASTLTTYQLRIESTTNEQLNLFEVMVYSGGVNVALQASASQSSTLNSFYASNAVDGSNSTFSHTDDSNAWWEVELSAEAEIEGVSIVNRYCRGVDDPTGCLCRLSYAKLILKEDDSIVATKTLGDTCNELLIEKTFLPAASTLTTYKLRIESTTNEQLNLFEVMVYSGGVNVALQASASQSSTLNSFYASNAVDGSNSTFSHTDDSNAWWEVELSAEAEIEGVSIVNRYCRGVDDPTGCLCRLSYAKLILKEDDSIVATKTLGDTCNELLIAESFAANA